MKINNLTDLRRHASEDAVKKIVTEYMMELIAKAAKMDAIEQCAEKGLRLKDVKNILEMESDETIIM